MEKKINFTSQALNQINKIAVGDDKKFFRITVQGGGCSGFKYNFSIDNNSNSNDMLIGKVLIDKTSHEFIKNSKLDFEENLMGKSFRISNPDATASCGCGISFSI